MSSDREIATDAGKVLGTIIDSSIKRDSVHIAVEPVIANCVLRPGQPIKLIGYESDTVAAANYKDWQGVVDPFLPRNVERGERFLMFLKPGSMMTLRHVWDAPGFKPSIEKVIEIEYVEECCSD